MGVSVLPTLETEGPLLLTLESRPLALQQSHYPYCLNLLAELI